ncbi:hypothetical protein ABT097_32510 [Streptomyces sp. NPDC002225]
MGGPAGFTAVAVGSANRLRQVAGSSVLVPVGACHRGGHVQAGRGY